MKEYIKLLFITNYCSARCEHSLYSKELNNKIEELNLENIKKLTVLPLSVERLELEE